MFEVRLLPQTVERDEGGVGIVAIGGIEGIVRRVAIRRIDGVAGIKQIHGVEGIIRRAGKPQISCLRSDKSRTIILIETANTPAVVSYASRQRQGDRSRVDHK